jgi:teichuronic acid biosynthesis glycosyltransferase TuaC
MACFVLQRPAQRSPERIAVVTSYFPTNVQPYRGRTAYQMLRELQGRAAIRVFCPMTRYPSWLPPRHFPYSRVDLKHTVPGLDTEYFEYPALPVVSRPVNPAVCEHYLEARLRAFRPDLILNYFIYPEGCAATTLAGRLGIPVVLGVIGSDVNRIPDRLTRWHTQRALRRASGILTVSDQLREKAIELGAHSERARTVPNGCDLSIFHPMEQAAVRRRLGVPDSSDLITFVGWLAPTKGIQELVAASAALIARRPNLRIAFVGEGASLNELQAHNAQGPLKGRLLLPGPLSSSGVAEWLAAADLFCLPSYAEGCPNVVIEALACGTPVVATRVGGIPDLVDERRCGILVPPRDAASLERALDSALSKQWDRPAISAHWNRSWTTVADETFALCSDAMRYPVQ